MSLTIKKRETRSTGLAQCVYVKHGFGRVGGWCFGLVGLLLLWFLFAFGVLQFDVSSGLVCERVRCGGSEGSFISV